MITEKDLEAEFLKDTGLYRISPIGDFGNSHSSEFNKWCIEKLLEYKNNDNKKDILPT